MQPNQLTISPRGIELITRSGHDDCRLAAYVCPAGKVTIGYGHVLLPKFDCQLFRTDAARLGRLIADCLAAGRITQEAATVLRINMAQAMELLARDTKQTALFLNSVTRVPLNQNQFDALCSLIFNIGQGNYAESTLRKKLHDKDYAGAAAEFERWVMGTVGGKKQRLPGLITRRAAERALFEEKP
jgi:lysozyme